MIGIILIVRYLNDLFFAVKIGNKINHVKVLSFNINIQYLFFMNRCIIHIDIIDII